MKVIIAGDLDFCDEDVLEKAIKSSGFWRGNKTNFLLANYGKFPECVMKFKAKYGDDITMFEHSHSLRMEANLICSYIEMAKQANACIVISNFNDKMSKTLIKTCSHIGVSTFSYILP